MASRLVCLTLAAPRRDATELDDILTRVQSEVGDEHVIYRMLPAVGELFDCALLDRTATKVAWPILLDEGHDLVFHNAAFDLKVLMQNQPPTARAIMDKVDDNRVWDSVLREKLLANANGQLARRIDPFTNKPTERALWQLATLVMRYFGVDLRDEKIDPEAWRLRYAELDGVPLQQWPEEAVTYAMLDAVWPLLLIEQQERIHPEDIDGFPTRCDLDQRVSPPLDLYPHGIRRFAGEHHVGRCALAHSASAAWGLRTHEAYVDTTIEAWTTAHREGVEIGIENGFVRPPAPDKNCDALRVLVAAAYDRPLNGDPRDDLYNSAGMIKVSDKACRESGDTNLIAYATAKGDEKTRIGIALGFVAMKSSRNQKAIRARVAEAYGDLPLKIDADDAVGNDMYSDTGQLRIAREVLELSGDPILEEYAKSLASTKYLSNYAGMLREATAVPLTYGVDPLKATGRISLFKPPYHQPPKFGGFRECHIARPGWVYVISDYDQAELRGLAQVHHWWELGDGLRSMFFDEIDPHSVMGVDILKAEMHDVPEYAKEHNDTEWSYDLFRLCLSGELGPEWEKIAGTYRHIAKAANFGLPGGLGVRTFVTYARGMGVKNFDEDRGGLVKQVWKERYPENVAYLAEINTRLGRAGRMTVALPFTGIVRGGCTYTSGANTFFQSLVAAGFNYTAWLLFKEMYSDHGTALFGCRAVLPLHDEFILEAPEDVAPDAAARLEEVMIEGMSEHIPDVPITTEASLSRRWSKNAKPVFDDNGRLAVWEHKEAA